MGDTTNQSRPTIQELEGSEEPNLEWDKLFKKKSPPPAPAFVPDLPEFTDQDVSLPIEPPQTSIPSRTKKQEETILPKTDWATEDLKSAPHVKIKKVKEKKHLPQFLSPSQVEILINDCWEKDPLKGLFVRVLWVTGMRSSEALNLRPIDLRPDKELLHIRWQKSRKYKDRYVPCEPRTFQELQIWAKRLRADERFFPWSKQNAANWVGKHQKDCGFVLTRYGCHVMRHSFASYCYDQGMPISTLQTILGHSHPETTSIYAHLSGQIAKSNLEPIYAQIGTATGLTHSR